MKGDDAPWIKPSNHEQNSPEIFIHHFFSSIFDHFFGNQQTQRKIDRKGVVEVIGI